VKMNEDAPPAKSPSIISIPDEQPAPRSRLGLNVRIGRVSPDHISVSSDSDSEFPSQAQAGSSMGAGTREAAAALARSRPPPPDVNLNAIEPIRYMRPLTGDQQQRLGEISREFRGLYQELNILNVLASLHLRESQTLDAALRC
jgi:hypothetical protein